MYDTLYKYVADINYLFKSRKQISEKTRNRQLILFIKFNIQIATFSVGKDISETE